MEQWAEANRDIVASDVAQQRNITRRDVEITATLGSLIHAVRAVDTTSAVQESVMQGVEEAERRWGEARTDWHSATDHDERRAALDLMEDAIAGVSAAADTISEWLGTIPESPVKRTLQTVRDELEQKVDQWERMLSPDYADDDGGREDLLKALRVSGRMTSDIHILGRHAELSEKDASVTARMVRNGAPDFIRFDLKKNDTGAWRVTRIRY